jgi:hypothetical protein
MVMPSSVDDVTPSDEFTGESSESAQQDVPPIYKYYSYTARVTVSTDETIYAYTVSIADNDASITSRLSGAPEVDKEDSTLYFTMDELTCDVDAQDPHSFMVGKFQAWEACHQIQMRPKLLLANESVGPLLLVTSSVKASLLRINSSSNFFITWKMIGSMTVRFPLMMDTRKFTS